MGNSYRITVNDTLLKLDKAAAKIRQEAIKIGKRDTTKLMGLSKLSEESKIIKERITKDPTLHIIVDIDSVFNIKVNLKDSLVFSSWSCITQKHAVADLIKLDSIHINLVPEECIPHEQFEKMPKLFSFIGEKIVVNSIDLLYCDGPSMDNRYEAKYKVIQNISGKLTTDTVQFVAFDHYGNPAFAEHKYVLLFLTEHFGKLYHVKYQYFELYPTKDGRWARPGDPYVNERSDINKTVKAVPIKFKNTVVFKRYDYFPYEIRRKFPAPYFKISGDDIIPLSGAYLEDLLKIKKQELFKTWGYNFN